MEVLAHLCHCYRNDGLDRRQFSEAVESIVTVWDVLSCSMMFAQVEATVKEHFCEWWSDCDDGCSYRKKIDKTPPWQDGWRSLPWKIRTERIEAQTDKPITMRGRDARTAVTGKLRRRIFARDKHKCRDCGGGPPLDIHHIIPVADGGTADAANLECLCKPCHKARHATLRITA